MRVRNLRISASTLPGVGNAAFPSNKRNTVSDQTLDVRAGLSSEARKLRFLLGCQVHLHALKICENPFEGDILEAAEHHPRRYARALPRASLLLRRPYDTVVAYLKLEARMEALGLIETKGL